MAASALRQAAILAVTGLGLVSACGQAGTATTASRPSASRPSTPAASTPPAPATPAPATPPRPGHARPGHARPGHARPGHARPGHVGRGRLGRPARQLPVRRPDRLRDVPPSGDGNQPAAGRPADRGQRPDRPERQQRPAARTGLPVLLTCSTVDLQVTCGEVRHLRAGLARAPADVDFVRLTGVDHVLKQDPTGSAAGYTEPLPFSPQLQQALRAFVEQHLG